MRLKLIPLKTILLTVIALFIFSASAYAQVFQELRTIVTRQISIPFRGWSKVYNVGETINLFSYEKKSGKYHFGIYSDDFAFFIVTDDIPFDVKEKELKKLPKPNGDLKDIKDEKLIKHYKDAYLYVRKTALAGKYKTKSPEYLMSTDWDIPSVKENDPITIIGFKEKEEYTGYYFYFAIIKEKTADIYKAKYDKNTRLWNVPLHYLPSTEDPQVKAIINNHKEKYRAQEQARKEELRRIEEEKKLQEREEELRKEAEYQAYRDSIAAAKVEQDMSEMKRCTPAIIKVGGWKMDSAGGIEVDITFTNCTSQKVKYVYFRGYFLNAVGDKCRNDITGSTEWKYRGVGPIDAMPKELQKNYYPNVEFWRFGNPKFYSSIAHTFRLSSVTIEYMNGKKTTLSGAELKKRVKYESFWN